jgi:hypothetical protein
MWAITTKYLGPTDHKGSRIRAAFGDRGRGMSVTLCWADDLTVSDNHRKAAETLRNRMVAAGRWGGWHAACKLIMADIPDGQVFVFEENP